MKNKSGTIREYLKAVAENEPIGSGESHRVFEIPGTDYLLRTYRHWSCDKDKKTLEGFPDFLKRTTALTPVRLYAAESLEFGHTFPDNVGQAILTGYGDYFEITKRVSGKTLGATKYQYIHENGGMKTYQGMFEGQKKLLCELTELPDESWCNLIRQMQRMSAHGISADFLAKNIMYDKKTLSLSLIDTGYARREYSRGGEEGMNFIAAMNDWEACVKGFLKYDFGPYSMYLKDEEQPKLTEELQPYKDALYKKAMDCAKQVGGPLSKEEIFAEYKAGRMHEARLHRFPDAKIGADLDIDEHLEDVPKGFVEKLKGIEQYLGWQK